MDPTACSEPRTACVDLPAWPLQLLLRRHPEWRGEPAAVVAEDSPQAPLLWVNGAARRQGILPGMRYAAALSLDHDLRAGTVGPQELATASERLHRHLLRYSPRVEPARHEPGVFWLDARGLERLYGSLGTWAGRLHRSLERAQLVASVAVGFGRLGSYCLARTRRGVTLVARPADERAGLRQVPLGRLRLDPRLRDDLDRLGVRTVGELSDLPPAQVEARFGAAAAELHRLARGEGFAPLRPERPEDPEQAREVLDEPESDAWRLLFLLKRLLHPLLPRLADRGRGVAALHLELQLADRQGTRLQETLRPASPSLDAVLLLELVRLRLEQMVLDVGVERVGLTLEDTPAPAATCDLFGPQHRRDLGAARRALARVRAELGDAAVVRAEPRGGHLPEAAFGWVPLPDLVAPAPDPAVLALGPPPLVRRVLARSRPAAVPRPEFLQGGPYLVSGGWWQREVRRVYHFLRTGGDALLWLYHDQRRGRWRLQGRVE